MNNQSKLKSEKYQWILIPSVCLILLLGSYLFCCENIFYIVLSLPMLAASFIHFITIRHTKNKIYFIPMIFYFSVAMTIYSVLTEIQLLKILFIICSAISFVLLIYALSGKKIYWFYREIMELAARPVEDTSDGFTSRPFPASEASYTKTELLGLAKFLIKHTIAFPYYEDDRIVFVIPKNMFGNFLFFKRDYVSNTFVSFTYSGNISVNISKKDYKTYREELTFDKLCKSLGNLFKSFLSLHQQGESEKILERLKKL